MFLSGKHGEREMGSTL